MAGHPLKDKSAVDRFIRMAEIRDSEIHGNQALAAWDEQEKKWLFVTVSDLKEVANELRAWRK